MPADTRVVEHLIPTPRMSGITTPERAILFAGDILRHTQTEAAQPVLDYFLGDSCLQDLDIAADEDKVSRRQSCIFRQSLRSSAKRGLAAVRSFLETDDAVTQPAQKRFVEGQLAQIPCIAAVGFRHSCNGVQSIIRQAAITGNYSIVYEAGAPCAFLIVNSIAAQRRFSYAERGGERQLPSRSCRAQSDVDPDSLYAFLKSTKARRKAYHEELTAAGSCLLVCSAFCVYMNQRKGGAKLTGKAQGRFL